MLRGATAALREGGLHVRPADVRAPSELSQPRRTDHLGALLLRAHEACCLAGMIDEAQEAWLRAHDGWQTAFDSLDVRTVCSKFSLRVAKKEPKSVALGSIPTKGAKNSCLPFYKASYFPIYLRFAIRTRFFSPPTDSIFVPVLQPPPGSPQVVPPIYQLIARGYQKNVSWVHDDLWVPHQNYLLTSLTAI